MSFQNGQLYEFGEFRLDTTSRRLLHAGQIVTLTPKVFDLLMVLVQSHGRIICKEELLKAVWPDRYVEDGNLTQNISILRKALAAGATLDVYIETIPREGYRFMAAVDTIAAPVITIEPTSSPQPDLPDRSHPRMVLVRWSLALATLLAMLGVWNPGGWRERLRGQGNSVAVRSLAVLPLEDVSGVPGQGYLADNVTDQLITDLAGIGALRVTSRTSVMRFKGSRKPLREIAAGLDVDAIVEGSVLRSASNVRITAQLVHAASGRHLWAHTYEGRLRDVPTLQREAAMAIAQRIQIELSPQEKVRLTSSRPIDPEAQEAYFQGRYYWNTRRTKEGLEKAIGFFERAVARDPNYAQAYSGMADSFVLLGSRSFLPPNEAFSRAKTEAIKALALDNTLAEAHAAPAFAGLYYDWKWDDAEWEFRRAIEVNPGYSNAHHWYSHFLIAMGRFEESLAESQRCIELDPLDPGMAVHLGEHFLYARQYDEAIRQLLKAIEMDASRYRAHDNLGRVYEQKGMHAQALVEFEKAVATSQEGTATRASLSAGYAAAGRRNDALRIVKRLMQDARKEYVPTYGLAEIYAALGDKNEAFAWLERAFQERSSAMVYLKVEPRLAGLHSDSRFQDLVRRMRLPK
jgi:DNA-binding winged helix-turn-helix (wHTH) protein/TolB-like protein/Tfp pilus assembly protein PilF